MKEYIHFIDESLALLGLDPENCRTDNKLMWYLNRGSARIYVALRDSENYKKEPLYIVVVGAPIAKLPRGYQRRQDVLEFMASWNHRLITEVFSISEETIFLSATYPLIDRSEGAFSAQLDSLSFYADVFDGLVRQEFPDLFEDGEQKA